MFTVRKEIEFDAGHRVPFHDSQCRRLHGHRWKVVACVEAEELVTPDPSRADSGMVVDYGIIKKVLMERIHAAYDHRFLLWIGDPLARGRALDDIVPLNSHASLLMDRVDTGIVIVPVIPTSEGLARFFYELIQDAFTGPLRLAALELYETPTSVARYAP